MYICGNSLSEPSWDRNWSCGRLQLSAGKGRWDTRGVRGWGIGNTNVSASDAIPALPAMQACLCTDCFLLLTLKS